MFTFLNNVHINVCRLQRHSQEDADAAAGPWRVDAGAHTDASVVITLFYTMNI